MSEAPPVLFRDPDSQPAVSGPAAARDSAARHLLFRAHTVPPAGIPTPEVPHLPSRTSGDQTTTPAHQNPVVACDHDEPAGTSAANLPPMRGYQQEAIDAIVDGLTGGGRGQLRAACGSGKSLMALHAALRLCPSGLVVVACPSLSLVAQTLTVWAAAGAAEHVLAVCSDETMADAAVTVADLACPVTTSAAEISDWLRYTPSGRLRLILVTHASAGVLGEGLLHAGTTTGLLIVDEAHHSAGAFDKHSALIHHDQHLPADRRLYMTATPRVLTAKHRSRRGAQDLLSMDDPAVFGPVLYTYPFAQAIEEGWLDDYQVVVIGVTSADALRILRNLDPDAVVDTARAPLLTAVVQTALIRAAVEFGLRRELVFHSRIAQSKEFTRSLPGTLQALPEADRPPGPLSVGHVDGNHTATQRQRHLDTLTQPPGGGWAVVSNARCLGEGVDVPAVDAVVFAAPKDSPPDVIQAVGRALRRSAGGSGVATVLVPVLLPDDPADAVADIEEDTSAWATLLQVLRALRAYDGTLAADLDTQRGQVSTSAATLPPRIHIRLPDGYATDDLLRQITVRVLEETTSNWLVGYAALCAFHAEHGHTRIPEDYVSAGIRLAGWASAQRIAYRQGRLSTERVERLEAIGFSWAPQGEVWALRYAAAKQFHQENGHLRIPPGYVVDGDELYPWLRGLREQYRNGTLSADRIRRLEAIGIVWAPIDQAWEQVIMEAQKFHAEHGHLRVPRGDANTRNRLYDWLVSQRRLYKKGALSADKIRRLEAIAIVWDPKDEAWDQAFSLAEKFYAEHGHLRVPDEHITEGVNLKDWIYTQRNAYKKGTLRADKIRRLEAIGMIWSPRDEAWEQGFAAAQEFQAEYGHLRAHAAHLVHGVHLKRWLTSQRHLYKNGKLSAVRVQRLQALGVLGSDR